MLLEFGDWVWDIGKVEVFWEGKVYYMFKFDGYVVIVWKVKVKL